MRLRPNNVVPTPQDIYPTRSLDNNALIQPESRQAFARLLAQGWTDAMRRLGSRSPLRCESLPEDIGDLLVRVQNQLFNLGAELATPQPEKLSIARIGATEIAALEAAIDHHEATLEPLKQFILPGGVRGAALLHLARTVCRRAERATVTLARSEPINAQVIVYLNRLSDLLFVLARVCNRDGQDDVMWVPGGNPLAG